MSGEGFCDRHGPYDASLAQCPYCARERGLPQAPPPLDDELETDPWGGRERPVGGGTRSYEVDDEEVTEWPRQRRESWEDDEELTEWPSRRQGDWDDDETVVERAETGLLGFLIIKEGMRRGQVHRIRHGTTIGRREAKIILRDPKVSRSHAKFTVEDDQFHIWDFGSENGTFVNGKQIREATSLQENDTIKVGDTAFVLKTLE